MRTSKLLTLIVSAAMGLIAQTDTTTKPTPPTPAQMAANRVSHLTTILTLTSDQQSQALTIFTAEETTLATLRDSTATARAAVTTAVEANDTAGLTTAATQIGTLTTQTVQAKGQADAAFYLLLTAAQQTIYKELLTMGGGPGPGNGPGPGGNPGQHGSGGPPSSN